MSEHLSENLLNEYLDGFLSSSQTTKVEAHLATCAECTARAATLRALFATLDEWPDLPLERDFTKAVLGAVHPGIPLPRRWKWAAGGQLALTIVLIAVSLPTLLKSEWLATLQLSPNPIPEPFSHWIFSLSDWVQTSQEAVFQWIQRFETLEVPSPFTLTTLIPILLATGLLWLVGNGLLLRKTK
ncbi:MAG: hypothetical protein Fur0022_09730 [Anaerolineales bacterium]